MSFMGTMGTIMQGVVWNSSSGRSLQLCTWTKFFQSMLMPEHNLAYGWTHHSSIIVGIRKAVCTGYRYWCFIQFDNWCRRPFTKKCVGKAVQSFWTPRANCSALDSIFPYVHSHKELHQSFRDKVNGTTPSYRQGNGFIFSCGRSSSLCQNCPSLLSAYIDTSRENGPTRIYEVHRQRVLHDSKIW